MSQPTKFTGAMLLSNTHTFFSGVWHNLHQIRAAGSKLGQQIDCAAQRVFPSPIIQDGLLCPSTLIKLVMQGDCVVGW